MPLLCQFVEGWLLQVGPDSVFEVNEALWDIEVAVQVEQFCDEIFCYDFLFRSLSEELLKLVEA